MNHLFFLLLLPIFSAGQTLIKGKVINFNNKLPIAYVTVGLIKENIGTTALEDGTFQLTSNKRIESDTMIFSCIGYETLKLPINSKLPGEINVELVEKVTILNEVVVSNKKNWITTELNEFSNCGNDFFGTTGYQTQIAQHFQVETENSLLTEIKICRMSIALLNPEKTIFRIRIYDIDTLTKVPSNDLCDQIIEVKTRSKTINLNLENYKILIPSKEFFVAIEWLKIPFNEEKVKMKTNGKEVEFIRYRPSIGWEENKNTKMEAWILDYKNSWRPILRMNNKTSFNISATVKY